MTTDILRHSEPTKWVKNLYCVAKASESELALRRSRLLFFLVGVHVILSFLIGKKRKNNGYEKKQRYAHYLKDAKTSAE